MINDIFHLEDLHWSTHGISHYSLYKNKITDFLNKYKNDIRNITNDDVCSILLVFEELELYMKNNYPNTYNLAQKLVKLDEMLLDLNFDNKINNDDTIDINIYFET